MTIVKAFTVLLLFMCVFSMPENINAQAPGTTATPFRVPAGQAGVDQPYVIQVDNSNLLLTFISIAALTIALIGVYTKTSVPVTILRVESVPTVYDTDQARRLAALVDEGTDLTMMEVEQRAESIVTSDPAKIAELLRSGQTVMIPGATDIPALLDALQKNQQEAAVKKPA